MRWLQRMETGVAIGCFCIGTTLMNAKLFAYAFAVMGLKFAGPIAVPDISWSTIVVLLCAAAIVASMAAEQCPPHVQVPR